MLPYVASKFAVRGMTHCLAGELAPHNITVNTVRPGVLATDLHSGVVRAFAEIQNTTEEGAWEWFRGRIPLGRFQEPSDIGNIVTFLSSDLASTSPVPPSTSMAAGRCTSRAWRN